MRIWHGLLAVFGVALFLPLVRVGGGPYLVAYALLLLGWFLTGWLGMRLAGPILARRAPHSNRLVYWLHGSVGYGFLAVYILLTPLLIGATCALLSVLAVVLFATLFQPELFLRWH